MVALYNAQESQEGIMSKPRFVAYTIWAVASIFYAYQYILRVMPSIMLNDLMDQFHMDAAIFGQFSGIYYIGYVGMMLPLGVILDKYGPKKVMTGCILLTVIGSLPIVFTTHWIYPIIGRFLIGIGSAAAILGAFKIIRMSFAEKHFTRMLSLSVSIGLLGAIYGGGPVSYLCQSVGYKDVVIIFAVLGLILAIATYFIVPEMKEEHTSSVLSDIKEVICNIRVICTCIFAGLMVGPLEGFADVWGTIFLKQVYGFDGNVAASLPSMIFMGMCFGSPILSLFAEKTNALGTIIAAGLVMAASFFAMLTGIVNVTAMSILFILIGVACAYQIIAIYKASSYVPDHVVGLTTAFTNMAIMFFGYIFHTAIGATVHNMGGIGVNDALIYGIGIIPVALTVGIIGFVGLMVTEKKGRR